MTLLINASRVRPDWLSADDYAIYGGTFDPLHEGHMTVIRHLVRMFTHVYIAANSSNPWKGSAPSELARRREMIAMVLDHEGLLKPPGCHVEILDHPFIYAEEVIATLRSTRPGTAYWAVGEDTAGTVYRWRNWNSLHVPVLVFPIEIDVHATHVRSGGHAPHPALAEYLARHRLYGD